LYLVKGSVPLKKLLLIPLLLLVSEALPRTTIKVGVICVEFKDVKRARTATRPYGYLISDFNKMMFDTLGGWYDTTLVDGTPSPDTVRVFGSASDYWWKASNRRVRIIGQVVNPETASTGAPLWLTLDSNKSYYTFRRSFLMYEGIYKACLNNYFDSTYTHFAVIFARDGGAAGLYPVAVAIPEERSFVLGTFAGIGTFTHETGHACFLFNDEYYNDSNPTRLGSTRMFSLQR
jgi:hypothetical protein